MPSRIVDERSALACRSDRPAESAVNRPVAQHLVVRIPWIPTSHCQLPRAVMLTPEAEVDLRVGGKVRVVMRKPDGTEAGAQGEYRLIDRPHRLVMRHFGARARS